MTEDTEKLETQEPEQPNGNAMIFDEGAKYAC